MDNKKSQEMHTNLFKNQNTLNYTKQGSTKGENTARGTSNLIKQLNQECQEGQLIKGE